MSRNPFCFPLFHRNTHQLTEIQRISFVGYTGGEGGSPVCGTYKTYTLYLRSLPANLVIPNLKLITCYLPFLITTLTSSAPEPVREQEPRCRQRCSTLVSAHVKFQICSCAVRAVGILREETKGDVEVVSIAAKQGRARIRYWNRRRGLVGLGCRLISRPRSKQGGL